MTIPNGEPLTFPEWGYLGAGKFQRRDFQNQDLAKRAALGEGTLFGSMEFDPRDQILPKVPDYDLILIDCPPSNGFFTFSSLIAADEVIIPSRPSRFSVDGVAQAFETISYVQQRQNPDLTVKGVLILGYFTGQLTSEQIEQELRHSLDGLVFSTTIPHRTAMTKAEDARVPLTKIDEPGYRDLRSAFTDVYNQLNGKSWPQTQNCNAQKQDQYR